MASKVIVFVLENLDFLNFFPPPRNNNTNRTSNRKNIQHPLRYAERRGIQVFHIYRTVSNRHKIDGWGLIRDACRDYGPGGNGLGIFFHRNHYANLIHVYRITRVYILHPRVIKEKGRTLQGLKTWRLTLSRKLTVSFICNKVSESDGVVFPPPLEGDSLRRNIQSWNI